MRKLKSGCIKIDIIPVLGYNIVKLVQFREDEQIIQTSLSRYV